MKPKYLMECGCVATGVTQDNKPVCVAHSGLTVGALVVKEIITDMTVGLEGRNARCPDCGVTKPSRWDLPFFVPLPERDYDSYYCGCRGWD